MNKKNNSNLRPWQPGQSGNIKGRKLGSKNISTIVCELLEQDADEKLLVRSNIADTTNGQPTSYVQAIVLAMLRKALEGNVQAACWLSDQQERHYNASHDNTNGLFHTSKLRVEIVPPVQSAEN